MAVKVTIQLSSSASFGKLKNYDHVAKNPDSHVDCLLCAVVPYAAVEILKPSIASLQLEFGQSTSISQKSVYFII